MIVAVSCPLPLGRISAEMVGKIVCLRAYLDDCGTVSVRRLSPILIDIRPATCRATKH
jgi:hypothetical protein